MSLKQFPFALWLSILPLAHGSESSAYVGSRVCSQCHRAIAATQAKTNMAQTWQGLAATHILTPGYREDRAEGSGQPVSYHVFRNEAKGLQFETVLPGRPPLKAPVEAVIGGERHGVSFLARVRAIEGAQLARATLVEARYLHSTHENGLVLSAGFPEEKPSSYETALGRALSPSFEKKCLDCHGRPDATNADGGVRCESCHGPGRQHLAAAAAGKPRSGIVNPARLSGDQAMGPCAACHGGFSALSDPLPGDLLISNQVNALKNSECYIQSGGAIRCTNCHDPHQDAAPDAASKPVQTCLQCHSARVERHAALCPVNRDGRCLGCHMPSVMKGSFTMVDHWIRVHPEQQAATPSEHRAEWKTQIRPKRVFLRIVAAAGASRAAEAHERLLKGEPFFDVAGQLSVDPSAPGGGYLGEMWLDKMESKLADASAVLSPGDISPAIDAGSRHIILQRMPRDFRWQAEQLLQEGSELKAKGLLKEAAGKYQEALRIDPYFLRALIFFGTTLGQQGDAQRAAGILEFAARLYPNDPAAQYNLGIAYGALGRGADEIRAYRRALEIEPDLIPAYQNLGAALYAAGQIESAVDVYRRGLDANPLSAALNYNAAVILHDRGEIDKAGAAIAIARKIDPAFVKKQEAGH
jgi:tetratricopeptide (TPR) repeat protein